MKEKEIMIDEKRSMVKKSKVKKMGGEIDKMLEDLKIERKKNEEKRGLIKEEGNIVRGEISEGYKGNKWIEIFNEDFNRIVLMNKNRIRRV